MFARRLLLFLVFAGVVAAPDIASAQGWYWLAPPFDATGLTILDKTPLAQWQALGSFDRADECEAAKLTALKSAAWNVQNLSKLPESQRAPGILEVTRRDEHRRSASLCVSAADPRLAPRSTR
jgi:hypothetical protein